MSRRNPTDIERALAGDKNLTDADLSYTNLSYTNLSDADLSYADLSGADLTRAFLYGSNLTEANLTDTNLTGVRYDESTIWPEGFTPPHENRHENRPSRTRTNGMSRRNPTDIERALAGDKNLVGANLTDAILTDAILTGANLTDANLRHAKLTRAKLTRAKLTRAKLTGANLTSTNLYRAILTGADLGGADLGGADLGGADLSYANLTDAILTDAILTDAILTGVRYDESTIWPEGFTPPRSNGRRSSIKALHDKINLVRSRRGFEPTLKRALAGDKNLEGANLRDAYLHSADLTEADLSGAYLIGADLTDADLTGAILTDADLTEADLTGAILTNADLRGAIYDETTIWPEGFTPPRQNRPARYRDNNDSVAKGYQQFFGSWKEGLADASIKKGLEYMVRGDRADGEASLTPYMEGVPDSRRKAIFDAVAKYKLAPGSSHRDANVQKFLAETLVPWFNSQVAAARQNRPSRTRTNGRRLSDSDKRMLDDALQRVELFLPRSTSSRRDDANVLANLRFTLRQADYDQSSLRDAAAVVMGRSHYVEDLATREFAREVLTTAFLEAASNGELGPETRASLREFARR